LTMFHRKLTGMLSSKKYDVMVVDQRRAGAKNK
jgi:hypothetical protein